jgi:hypothetical protein
LKETNMRLTFATIVAAAGLAAIASPALADDGERGHGHGRDRGYHSDGERGRDWRDNRHNYRGDRGDRWRSDNRHYDRNYWGPSGRYWTRWDRGWGDPHRYARQWGFDRFDHNRGWQRGNTWYASPSQWSDWGGWNWSFSVSNGGFNNYTGYNNHYGHNGFGNPNCGNYRTEDWINGRRAIVTYVGCTDRFGRVFEQQGTRRIERWVW